MQDWGSSEILLGEVPHDSLRLHHVLEVIQKHFLLVVKQIGTELSLANVDFVQVEHYYTEWVFVLLYLLIDLGLDDFVDEG